MKTEMTVEKFCERETYLPDEKTRKTLIDWVRGRDSLGHNLTLISCVECNNSDIDSCITIILRAQTLRINLI